MELRRLAKASKDAAQTRRLLALAAVYDGGSRGEAAAIGGGGVQTMRDWVLRFNAEGPEGVVDGKAPGGRFRAPPSRGGKTAHAPRKNSPRRPPIPRPRPISHK